MARRGDLAGLAALGALGYALTRGGKKAPVEDRSSRFAPDEAPAASDRMLYPDESSNTGGDYAPAAPREMRSAAPIATPAAPNPPMMSQEEMTRRRLAGGPRGRTGPATIRPASGSADTAGSIRAYEKALADQRYQERMRPEAQAIENVYPESNIIAPGLKALGAAAKNLASRAGLREYSQPLLQGTERKLLEAPPKQLTGPSKADLVARDRAARAAAREAEKEEFNRRAIDRFGESTFEGGMRKGGKVKAKAKKMASGGMAKSSASKRADGIATKGKTKCKMY